jgi:hypothetical protein
VSAPTLAPRARPTQPTDIASTNTRSTAGSLAHGTAIKVPSDRSFDLGYLVASLSFSVAATSIWSDQIALLPTLGAIGAICVPTTTTTAVLPVSDLRPILVGTSFLTVSYDNLIGDPFRSTQTRMGELQVLAPGLSLRRWADMFGVTKQAIRNWIASDPRDRPELDAALRSLRSAGARQADLSAWLQAQLPGSERTPLDLVKGGHWRALSAASRMAPPVGVGVPPTQAMRDAARERRAVSKLVSGPDAPAAGDEEE